MMRQLPVRLVRKWTFHHDLTLGDLRAIVAECDRRGLADTAHVKVDPRAQFIAGVDPDGNPEPPYPEGNSGHYVTEVTADGQMLPDGSPWWECSECGLRGGWAVLSTHGEKNPGHRITSYEPFSPAHDYSGNAARCRRCGVTRAFGAVEACREYAVPDPATAASEPTTTCGRTDPHDPHAFVEQGDTRLWVCSGRL